MPTNLTENDIRNYIIAKGIKEDDVKITKLVKQNVDLSLLSFISFKIDTNDSTYSKLIDSKFWPKECTIRDFVHKPNKITKKVTIAQAEHFLRVTQPTATET